jgi:IstB-like ATP binding protein
MKLMSQLAREYLPKKEEPKLIHAIQDTFVLKHLDSPILSHDVTCPMCGGKNGHSCLIDPKLSDKRMWFCGEDDCMALVKRSFFKPAQMLPEKKRALEWPSFCDSNGIGDRHHSVRFEEIDQDAVKIEYLLKFAKKPSGIIFMQGNSGSGKTYASMAVCELFTRNSQSAIFFTQNKMLSRWLEDEKHKYIQQLENCNLLVIDDFGTGEVPIGFMKFFLDLINTRMQWTDRGTIITTNLSDKDFSFYCGTALNDRIKTGQKFEFKDKSRRKQTFL